MAKDPAFETAPAEGAGYTPRADWYPDPEIPDHWRYWDGAAWSEERLPAPPNWSAGPQEAGVKRGGRAWGLIAARGQLGLVAVTVLAVALVIALGSRGGDADSRSPDCSVEALAFFEQFRRDGPPGLSVLYGYEPERLGIDCWALYRLDSEPLTAQQMVVAHLESLGYAVRVSGNLDEPQPDEYPSGAIDASAPGKPDVRVLLEPAGAGVEIELALADP